MSDQELHHCPHCGKQNGMEKSTGEVLWLLEFSLTRALLSNPITLTSRRTPSGCRRSGEVGFKTRVPDLPVQDGILGPVVAIM
jgi:hypothetical protein